MKIPHNRAALDVAFYVETRKLWEDKHLSSFMGLDTVRRRVNSCLIKRGYTSFYKENSYGPRRNYLLRVR